MAIFRGAREPCQTPVRGVALDAWVTICALMSLPFLTSPLLPVPHGFTTRGGGVSEGPYRSLNVSFDVGDVPERVVENIRTIARAANVPPHHIRTSRQIHGAGVLGDVLPDAHPNAASICGEADALWTAARETAVAVRVADCVPILLVDPRRRRVAAVHSGWRGSELLVAAEAVKALQAAGSDASAILAAVGPSIRACCYAVSAELASRFAARFGPAVVRSSGERKYLDLVEVVRKTLCAAGIRPENVDVLAHCTCCSPEHFFSHRRDGGLTGRQMAFAVCNF